jgi:hypothetical protein
LRTCGGATTASQLAAGGRGDLSPLTDRIARQSRLTGIRHRSDSVCRNHIDGKGPALLNGDRRRNMNAKLQKLIDASRNRQMTPEEQEAQRRSFAYGNAHIENERVTREMVDEAADKRRRA